MGDGSTREASTPLHLHCFVNSFCWFTVRQSKSGRRSAPLCRSQRIQAGDIADTIQTDTLALSLSTCNDTINFPTRSTTKWPFWFDVKPTNVHAESAHMDAQAGFPNLEVIIRPTPEHTIFVWVSTNVIQVVTNE